MSDVIDPVTKTTITSAWGKSVADDLDEIFLRVLPMGGGAGQVLTKNSASDFDASWLDVPESGIVDDPELLALAGLTSAADRLPYFTGSGTAALSVFNAVSRMIVASTTLPQWHANLGLTIGTDVAPARRPVLNNVNTAVTPTASDENTMYTLSNAAAITVTLPSNSTESIPIGAEFDYLWLGVGQPSFAAGAGATVNGTPGLKLRARYSAATAKKVATNDWVVIGDLAA